MAKHTAASNAADIAELRSMIEAIAAVVLPQGAAAVVTPPTAVVAVQPKADGKVYRSAKGKEAAKVAVDAAWTKAKKAAKVNRVKDLTPAQRAKVDAEVKAIWAAVPKTRSTKA